MLGARLGHAVWMGRFKAFETMAASLSKEEEEEEVAAIVLNAGLSRATMMSTMLMKGWVMGGGMGSKHGAKASRGGGLRVGGRERRRRGRTFGSILSEFSSGVKSHRAWPAGCAVSWMCRLCRVSDAPPHLNLHP